MSSNNPVMGPLQHTTHLHLSSHCKVVSLWSHWKRQVGRLGKCLVAQPTQTILDKCVRILVKREKSLVAVFSMWKSIHHVPFLCSAELSVKGKNLKTFQGKKLQNFSLKQHWRGQWFVLASPATRMCWIELTHHKQLSRSPNLCLSYLKWDSANVSSGSADQS